MLDIIPATMEHVDFVIKNITKEDAEEIKAYGITVDVGVRSTYLDSDFAWSAVAEEGVVCCWGLKRYKTLIGGGSQGWLVTTNLLTKYSRPFIREAKERLLALAKEPGYIEGYVDSRHQRALRFFEWLGFDLSGDIFTGPDKIPFKRIGFNKIHG